MVPNKNTVVGVSDAKIAKAPGVIATYSLGSCICVCLYDRRQRICGMLHFQLPESKIDEEKAKIRPFMFADTGLARLLEDMKSMGSKKSDLVVKIAGGASMQNGPATFEIGKRNFLAIRKSLWKAGLMIAAEDVGGESARTVYMDIASGVVTLKSAGKEQEL